MLLFLLCTFSNKDASTQRISSRAGSSLKPEPALFRQMLLALQPPLIGASLIAAPLSSALDDCLQHTLARLPACG